MKDDSLYIVAIVAVVAVVGLVIMATSSSTVVAQDSLPDMVESDSSAIAGQAGNIGGASTTNNQAGNNDDAQYSEGGTLARLGSGVAASGRTAGESYGAGAGSAAPELDTGCDEACQQEIINDFAAMCTTCGNNAENDYLRCVATSIADAADCQQAASQNPSESTQEYQSAECLVWMQSDQSDCLSDFVSAANICEVDYSYTPYFVCAVDYSILD